MSSFYPVIPAGGSGKRLWPLSRAGYPKFLMPLGGEQVSLLGATVDRLRAVAPVENLFVVTGISHAAHVAREIPALREDNLVIEPMAMDSAPAISLAAAIIAHRDPDAIMGSFAADHVIRNVQAFAAAVDSAIAGAEEGYLMTIGIQPTRPDTGYGYVQCGDLLGVGPRRRVLRFKEKPDRDLAQEYVASGEYLWNASMFVWRAESYLAELHRRDAGMHDTLREIAAAWDTDAREQTLSRLWPALKKIAIEYLVMEPAAEEGLVATTPGTFDWSDVGDFNALGDTTPADRSGNVILTLDRDHSGPGTGTDKVVVHDSHDLVIVTKTDRAVTIVGADQLAIVDMPDVLLVCSRDRVQDVKSLVMQLEIDGLSALL